MSFSHLSSPLCSNANLYLSILFQVLLQVKIQLKLIYSSRSFATFPVFLVKFCTDKSMISLFHEILLSLSFIHIVHFSLFLIIPSHWHGIPSYYQQLSVKPPAQHHRKLKSIGIEYTRFFYKQHFYKQHQTELGKKSSKR